MNLIGICGPSCSGKSTVADLVGRFLERRVYALDGYWRKGVAHIHVDGVRTFERPDQYDDERLLADLAGDGRAIAEGFVLFAYRALLERTSHRYFIELDWDEIVRRRNARPRSNGHADEGFDRIGRREWLVWGEGQRDLPGMIVLDGRRTPDELAKRIVTDVLAAAGRQEAVHA